MVDVSTTIAAKSDQLNADDLLGGPRTIRITGIAANPGSPEQPISLSFEGDGGKPYKPCKTVRRVLVQLWGKDGHGYVGKSMTLFRDPDVYFGGIKVGGIRVSHLSDIDREVTLALNASNRSKKQFTFKPLTKTQPSAAQGRPTANNGRADGVDQKPQPTLAERVANAKKALAEMTPAAALKAWNGPMKGLRADADRIDPEGLLLELNAAFAATQPQMEEADAY
jgi:hypothetical protein